VAVGKWGAANAGILAAQILALSDSGIKRRLAAYRRAMVREVEERSRKVAERLKQRT
jgi:5-(carboxyamino)imidazole ribonucleotide mutase